MNTNEVLLKLLVVIVRPDLPTEEVFEEAGRVYTVIEGESVNVGHYEVLIEEVRKFSNRLKKLEKETLAEARYQDWRSSKREDE